MSKQHGRQNEDQRSRSEHLNILYVSEKEEQKFLPINLWELVQRHFTHCRSDLRGRSCEFSSIFSYEYVFGAMTSEEKQDQGYSLIQ